jgi:hypothetical protein
MNEKPDLLNNPMVQAIAKTDFETAVRKGFWLSVKNWLTKKDDQLLPFDEVIKTLPIKGQHSIGTKEIPIEAIIGSVGRYHDFDRAFLPRQTHTKHRWMNIDVAHLQDIILPPIEVYKVGEVYFVKDGNHRVSVAREKGQVYIDADVIELDVIVPIDTSLSIDDIIMKREQAIFYEKTHLPSYLPRVTIEFSVPGGYEKLIEHIEVHQWFMGEERKVSVSWKEAIISWYSEVYDPLITIIQELNILKNFPHRTEADLYLWIIEHLYFLKEKYQEDISMEAAATHFTDEFAPNFFRRFFGIFREDTSLLNREEEKGKATPQQEEKSPDQSDEPTAS